MLGGGTCKQMHSPPPTTSLCAVQLCVHTVNTLLELACGTARALHVRNGRAVIDEAGGQGARGGCMVHDVWLRTTGRQP